ncbi:ribbon-helix-helix domain-containing protein [Planctomycetota bacterium]
MSAIKEKQSVCIYVCKSRVEQMRELAEQLNQPFSRLVENSMAMFLAASVIAASKDDNDD